MVIKMKDLIKAQGDELRKKFIWNEGGGAPPPGGGGEEEPSEPKKLKIDIPDSPFEPDINQVKDRLKQILKQWQVGEYPSDEYRWKSYFKDVQKLVKVLDGDK